MARTRALLDRALAALKEPRFLVPYRREGEWQGPFLMETTEAPDVELFGPFLALIPVDSEAAAVATVLQSRYPFLVSWFGTPPPDAKEALVKKFGMVYDNPGFPLHPPAPALRRQGRQRLDHRKPGRRDEQARRGVYLRGRVGEGLGISVNYGVAAILKPPHLLLEAGFARRIPV